MPHIPVQPLLSIHTIPLLGSLGLCPRLTKTPRWTHRDSAWATQLLPPVASAGPANNLAFPKQTWGASATTTSTEHTTLWGKGRLEALHFLSTTIFVRPQLLGLKMPQLKTPHYVGTCAIQWHPTASTPSNHCEALGWGCISTNQRANVHLPRRGTPLRPPQQRWQRR